MINGIRILNIVCLGADDQGGGGADRDPRKHGRSIQGRAQGDGQRGAL